MNVPSPVFVTLFGVGTVFFGLICIIVLTTIMGAVLKEKKGAAPAAAPAAAAPKAAAPAAPKVDTAKQQEIIAAITAAISEELGPRANGMTILDIKKL